MSNVLKNAQKPEWVLFKAQSNKKFVTKNKKKAIKNFNNNLQIEEKIINVIYKKM